MCLVLTMRHGLKGTGRAQFRKTHLHKLNPVWTVIYSKARLSMGNPMYKENDLDCWQSAIQQQDGGGGRLVSKQSSAKLLKTVLLLWEFLKPQKKKATTIAGSSDLINDRLSLSPTSPTLESSQVFPNEQQSPPNQEVVLLLQTPVNLQSHGLEQARDFLSCFLPLFPVVHRAKEQTDVCVTKWLTAISPNLTMMHLHLFKIAPEAAQTRKPGVE